jgi:exosortase N
VNFLTTIQTKRAAAIMFIIIAALASLPVIKVYFPLSINLSTFSLLLIPFILYVKEKDNHSYRFGVVSLALIILYLVIDSPVILLVVFFTLLLFIAEVLIGKLNNLIFMLLFYLTPLTSYFFTIAGFYIRLVLTKWAALLINLIAGTCTSAGNIILYQAKEFTVEPACMGLNMVRTSFLFSLFFLALFQKKSRKQLSFLWLITIQFITFLLVVLANFLRIVSFVLFDIQAESIFHELGGLVCIVIMVTVPLYYIIKTIITNTTRTKTVNQIPKQNVNSRLAILLITGTIIFLFTRNYFYPVVRENVSASINYNLFKGYSETAEPLGVKKLTSDAVFVYIKPPVQFYRSDHYPLICWTGSGYSVIKEEITEIAGVKAGIATVSNGSKIYYTIWWYDNGMDKTAGDMEWRYNNFLGAKDYCLVNIASQHKPIVLEEAERLIRASLIKG